MMPVLTVRADEPGPSVVVGANLHGDECTGIGVVHALVNQLPTLLTRGSVHLYPTLNPKGLEQATRAVPGDPLDPNRAFPGSMRGSPTERHAWRIWSDLISRRPALYIDLHTDSGDAIPYAIVDRVIRGRAQERMAERCVEVASASGLTVLREYPVERYRRFELDRSLPGALVNGSGIPAVTLEVGPRRRVDPRAVEVAFHAVVGILSSMWMARQPAPLHPTRRADGVWRRDSGPRTGRNGLLIPLLSPGDSFTRGQPLVEVRGLGGDVREVLRAPSRGFMVALTERTHIALGAATCTIAVPEEGAS